MNRLFQLFCRGLLLLCLVGNPWLGGLWAEEGTVTAGPLQGYGSLHPLVYFAGRVGGDLIRISCLVPEGEDPGTWLPDRETVGRLQRADVIFISGANFEQWPDKVSLPLSKVVNTTVAYEKDYIRFEKAIVHSHGPGGMHAHEGIDGHTWVDPQWALRQAEAIKTALVNRRPADEAILQQNWESLRRDLLVLDDELKRVAPRLQRVALFANHPAYQYLAREYGVTIVNCPLDPEKAPTADDLTPVKAVPGGPGGRLMLWETQPCPAAAQRLTEMGIVSIVFSPAENPSAAELQKGENYLTIMKANLARLETAVASLASSATELKPGPGDVPTR